MEGLSLFLQDSNAYPLTLPTAQQGSSRRKSSDTSLSIEGKEIGAGNYGTVFKAKYNLLPCIVKVLHPSFQNNGFRDAVYRECSRIALLRHPNLVQFLGVQDYFPASMGGPVSQPMISLITELMDEDLTTFLSRQKKSRGIPWHLTINICHDIVLALHYLHTKSITYNILSSNNVLFLNGRAKISDLGISKLQLAFGDKTTSAYIAPEVRMNQPTLQSDVFSFGVLLIQMITLKHPEPKFVLSHDRSSGSLALATEISRRKSDLTLISRRHKLRPMAVHCIADSEHSRPTPSELCNDFECFKKRKEFKKSIAATKSNYKSSSSSSSYDDDSSDESDSDGSTSSGSDRDSTETETDSESD